MAEAGPEMGPASACCGGKRVYFSCLFGSDIGEGKKMNRFSVLLITFLVLPFLAFSGGPNAYALGHYGIPGTVEGCDVCHDFSAGFYDSPGSGNLRWVKSTIEWPTGTFHSPVKFTKFESLLPADGTLADGDDGKLDGPCEVCHTSTNYHTNAGDGTTHFDGVNCTTCHPHFVDDIVNYFEPRFIGTQSHTTHFTDPKGPLLGSDPDCTICHYPGDFHLFGSSGDTLQDTTVCDACHSPDGAFNGSTEGKLKWEDSVYESNGYDLKTGNENWCATCHDNGTSVVAGVSAPNVMGDNSSWGYNISGHGYFTVKCEDCHDLAVSHTDGDARTYSVPAATTVDYRAGYRLDGDMTIPRVGGSLSATSFRLCFDNCHIFSNIFGTDDTTNFRDDLRGLQYHSFHLDSTAGFACWDSDWDGSLTNEGGLSCPACHNLHGSPTPAMTRHGELISSPGTTDKVPALDFRWYTSDGATQTTVLAQSRYGALQAGGGTGSLNNNQVCSFCHSIPPEEIQYYRVPTGVPDVKVNSVWTTDLSNIVKNSFAVGEDVRYHVSFQIIGAGSYYMVSPGKRSKSYETSGADWETRLKKTGTLSAGTHEWTWDKTIPGTATPGSGAEVKIQIRMWDAPGGTLIDKNLKKHTFSIAP
jgi:hypothetical protein